MDRATFIEKIKDMTVNEIALYRRKAQDYSDPVNVFSHFQQEASKLGITPQKVLLVYLEKHLTAIAKYANTGEQDNEGIDGRIADARIYLALLQHLPQAQQQHPTEQEPAQLTIDCTVTQFVPTKAHPDDAGFDLLSTESFTLKPGERYLAPTGVCMFIPQGFECQIRPKSGLAVKYGLTVLNSPGTIDSGYTGEVGVPLINHGTETVNISVGQKIAQAVVCKLPDVCFNVVETKPITTRGNNGFGSTGV